MLLPELAYYLYQAGRLTVILVDLFKATCGFDIKVVEVFCLGKKMI